ncbi:MAG: hypothetical protein DRG78_14955 [Epsilonproteobacteria bacterium]|nr:MAG: hypothetical protein DRG78_14955 [Campylobacterota bacterium]
MNLNKDKLEKLLKMTIGKNIRFEKLNKLFDKIEKTDVKIDENEVKIDSEEVKIDGKNPSTSYFGPEQDSLTREGPFNGVLAMAKKFYSTESESKQLVLYIGAMLGGFDFKTHRMFEEYRIISNGITSKNDYSDTLTCGRPQHPSSNFADNNYFFNIINYIKKLRDCTDCDEVFINANIVLRYPGQKFKIENDDEKFSEEYQKQKEVLKHRFPPKFLWMWANKDTVIHPFSLMAFRNFLNTEYAKEIIKEVDKNYTPESITNMEFDVFTKAWNKISNKILEDLKLDSNTENISKISKLISIIMTGETDIKNISDLLTTGNKAVILWGPPGTGKTYESEQVVKEILEIDEDENDNYLFSNKNRKEDTNGYYEIVQFHPNYTYQDFIGGITPKLDDAKKDISYILREGVFKRFCDEAKENKSKKYIFIIDEINRAELSAVFGELLYGLEYRGKPINLPNFKEPFIIPENVYIIGTMNNVDKSLVTFDLALRRRFGFFKLMPKLDVLEDVLSDRIKEESLKQYVKKCKQLNILISKSTYTDKDKELLAGIKNYDKLKLELGLDYQIGQAYFLKIQDFLPEQEKDELQTITSFDLEKLWIYNLEPLLEEYLGMQIEDDTSTKLENLKKEFEDIK